MNASPQSLQGDLEARLRFETLVADLAMRFVNLPIGEFESEIGRAQREVCELLGFDRSTFWQVIETDPPTFELLFLSQPDGMPRPAGPMDTLTYFPWVTEQVLRGEIVLLNTLDDLPAEAVRDRETLERFATRSSAIFPIRIGGEVVALLTFATTSRPRDWPAALVTRLGLVAHLFGSALSRKAADEEQRQSEAALRDLSGRLISAQERERAWLAKELHDGLNQQLAMFAVELDLLGQRPPRGTAGLRARLDELSARAKTLSGEVHRLSHGLHPSKLERLGLVAAIRGFCRELEAGSVTVRFSSSDVPRKMAEEVALCLYRVTQESLWNVVRHSGARQAVVELHAAEAEIHLRVMDDGKGFEPAAAGFDSLGLVSMRERVAMVGGAIRWESRPGGGTTVVARVPIPPEATT
jgi:signal transduction histidine kinase